MQANLLRGYNLIIFFLTCMLIYLCFFIVSVLSIYMYLKIAPQFFSARNASKEMLKEYRWTMNKWRDGEVTKVFASVFIFKRISCSS